MLLFGLAISLSQSSHVYAAPDTQTPEETNSTINSGYYTCEQIPNTSPMKGQCQTCAGDINGEPQGMWTAIGCISVNPVEAVKTFVLVGISIAGGVGFLSIIMAGAMYSLSTGDAKRTTDAKELLTSAVIGLLFIIFSITILQFIASDLMQIPGFGSN